VRVAADNGLVRAVFAAIDDSNPEIAVCTLVWSACLADPPSRRRR
jgi:hypothetical protein